MSNRVENFSSQNLDEGNMPRGFNIKNVYQKLPLWLLLVDSFAFLADMFLNINRFVKISGTFEVYSKKKLYNTKCL